MICFFEWFTTLRIILVWSERSSFLKLSIRTIFGYIAMVVVIKEFSCILFHPFDNSHLLSTAFPCKQQVQNSKVKQFLLLLWLLLPLWSVELWKKLLIGQGIVQLELLFWDLEELIFHLTIICLLQCSC